MKQFFKDINGLRVIQALLITGAVLLAYHGLDGWGWLIFAFVLTL